MPCQSGTAVPPVGRGGRGLIVSIALLVLALPAGCERPPLPGAQDPPAAAPPVTTRGPDYRAARHATMPSFDIVSEVDTHELTNAVDQANRELDTRFDFKGVEAKFVRDEDSIAMSAPSEFQLQQMTDILRARLVARKIDARCLEFGDVETNLAGARQKVAVKQGIERELAKKLQASIKDAKLKVDTQINGDKLRVSGKKRDDLQAAMALLRAAEFERPLQFDNFRD